jgi:tripartite ATP-independent transporter DctP family solute receptor
MMTIYRCSLALTLLAGGALVLASGAQAQTVTLKLGEIYAQSHTNGAGALKLAELVAQKTQGQVKIEVFLDSKLGSERETAEGVVAGTIDIAPSGLGGIGRFIQPIHALELPYIYTGLDHLKRVSDAMGPDINKLFAEKGVRNIGFFFLGPRVVAARKQVRSLEDLKGLRLRVPESPLYVGMARALGATPTPIAFPEAYTSLQTGVVDAVEGDPGTLFSTKWYEPAKYIAQTEHIWHLRYIVMNEASFKKLSSAQQSALLEAGKEATAYQLGLVRQFNKDALDKIKAAGGEIIAISDIAAFAKALEPFNKEYAAKLGGQAIPLLQKAMSVK